MAKNPLFASKSFTCGYAEQVYLKPTFCIFKLVNQCLVFAPSMAASLHVDCVAPKIKYANIGEVMFPYVA